MSASNWAVCPRCLSNALTARDGAFQHALSLYGVIPVEEWQAATAAADALPSDPDEFVTFREDYEIYGAKSGTITVSYSGHCSVCNLGLDFKDERPFYEVPE